jgi:hypothetical protein
MYYVFSRMVYAKGFLIGYGAVAGFLWAGSPEIPGYFM